nr:hypothetical protein [uncultured Campylobacter sp.]
MRAIGFCRDIGLRGSFSKNVANPRKIKLNLQRSGRGTSDIYAVYLGFFGAALHGRDDENADYEGMSRLGA